MRRLVGVLEDDELQLGAGEGVVAQLGGALAAGAFRIVRGDWTTGWWSGQTRSHWTIAVAGRCGEQPDRVEVEDELHVAVAALPRGDRVAVDGVHVDVDAEQVVAALGAVARATHVEEVAPVQPLALQPALHVGEGDDDGVDLAGLDPRPQLVDARGAGRCGVMDVLSQCASVSAQQAAQQRGRVVAVLLHRAPRLGRLALEDRP